MNARTDESGALPALEGDDDDAVAAEDARRDAILDGDPLDLADEAMTRVGEIVTTLRDGLEDERACTRLLRTELAKAYRERDEAVREVARTRRERDDARRELEASRARLAKTA